MERPCFDGSVLRPYSVTTRDDLLRDIEGSPMLLELRTALVASATGDEACDFASPADYFASPIQ